MRLPWAKVLSQPFVTTEYVVWETINGLSKSLDRPKAYALLDDMSDASCWEVIAANSDLLAQGIQMHHQHADKEWSLTDCVSFVIMRERGIQQALAHDHHFEQAGFKSLLRHDPP